MLSHSYIVIYLGTSNICTRKYSNSTKKANQDFEVKEKSFVYESGYHTALHRVKPKEVS